jgi:perosamine synthetase
MIPWARPTLVGNEQAYVRDALESTWISGGAYVDRFERDFAAFCGAGFGIATSNCTTALHLTLVALGIGAGDEVIVPAFTFAAPATVAIQAGARVVLADVDPETWCLDPQRVKDVITPRTKAIVAVHVYGQPCDMEALLAIAGHNGLAVIEDAAEAHGSKCRGRSVGTVGAAGCFSFHAATVPKLKEFLDEGGIVLTNDETLAGRLRLLRDHGMRKGEPYWHDALGFNYRLTNYQAAMGCAQLERIDDLLARRREIEQQYRLHMKDIPGLGIHVEAPWAQRVPWGHLLLVEPRAFGMGRDELRRRLAARGIETRPGFHPLHTLPMYGFTGRFPNAEHLGTHVVSLPTSHGLSEAEIKTIAEAIREEQAAA